MRHILAPTDFSETANNAVRYAVQLAAEIHADLTILHSYHLPTPVGEAPMIVITADELERDSKTRLEQLAKEVNSSSKINIRTVTRIGFAEEEIIDFAGEEKVDLILMGIKGSGKLNQVLIGSSTTGVIKRMKYPVLVVPDKYTYKKLQHVAYASDYKKIDEEKNLGLLKQFCKTFNSRLSIVNVVKPHAVPTIDNAIAGMNLESFLEDISHESFYPENEDIESGLNEFIDARNPDILVMLPHKHNFLQRILGESHTRHMTFQAKIPLLALPA